MKIQKPQMAVLAGILLTGAGLLAQTAPSNPGPQGGPNAGGTNPAGITPGGGRPATTPPASGTTVTTPTTGTGGTTGNTMVTPKPTTPPSGAVTTGTTGDTGVRPANPPATGGTTTTPTTGTSAGTAKPMTPPAGMPTTGTMPPPAMPPRVNENASDRAKEVTAIVQQFDANRDKMMADRAELMKKLDAAKSEAEKQAILTQLRTETQAEREEQAKLGKQIREQLKGAGRRPGG